MKNWKSNQINLNGFRHNEENFVKLKKKFEEYKKNAIKKQSELVDVKSELEEVMIKQEENVSLYSFMLFVSLS